MLGDSKFAPALLEGALEQTGRSARVLLSAGVANRVGWVNLPARPVGGSNPERAAVKGPFTRDAASSYGPPAELSEYPACCQAIMPPSRFQTLL
jgi:hypothetical protein